MQHEKGAWLKYSTRVYIESVDTVPFKNIHTAHSNVAWLNDNVFYLKAENYKEVLVKSVLRLLFYSIISCKDRKEYLWFL